MTNLDIKEYGVREITTKDTYPIRHSELRKGKPLETCQFKGDNLDTTTHIGGFFKEELTAVATFLKQDNTVHHLKNACQLRGMAVAAKYHKKGFGKILLTFGERLIHQKGMDFIWMNARIGAVDFYKKAGYTSIGKAFEIPKIGTHYTMFKKLDS